MGAFKKGIVVVLVLVLALGVYVGIGIPLSRGLEQDRIGVATKKQGEPLKIAHLSDLHYPFTPIALDDLVFAIASFQPDLIALTGDVVDALTTKAQMLQLEPFFLSLSRLAPCYAVPGNHEAANDQLATYKALLSRTGVTYLLDDVVVYQKPNSNKQLLVMGLKDNGDYFSTPKLAKQSESIPLLLLAHRADKWNQYLTADAAATHPPALTLAGHNHGGQIRLFGKGLLAPGRRFLPAYTSGLVQPRRYQSALVVSRGLGESDFKNRIHNRYHLPLVTLYI